MMERGRREKCEKCGDGVHVSELDIPLRLILHRLIPPSLAVHFSQESLFITKTEWLVVLLSLPRGKGDDDTLALTLLLSVPDVFTWGDGTWKTNRWRRVTDHWSVVVCLTSPCLMTRGGWVEWWFLNGEWIDPTAVVACRPLSVLMFICISCAVMIFLLFVFDLFWSKGTRGIVAVVESTSSSEK